MAEKDFSAELLKAAKDYMEFTSRKGTEFKPLNGAQIPAEVKEELGLAVFPEDIQNLILFLSQKLTHFILVEAQKPLEKGPSWGQKFINALADTPSKDMLDHAVNNSLDVFSILRSTPLKPLSLPLSIGTFGSYLLGAQAGNLIGRMQHESPLGQGGFEYQTPPGGQTAPGGQPSPGVQTPPGGQTAPWEPPPMSWGP